MIVDNGASEHIVVSIDLFEYIHEIEEVVVELADRSKVITRNKGKLLVDPVTVKLICSSDYFIPDHQLTVWSC